MSLWDAVGIAPTTGVALAATGLVVAALLALRLFLTHSKAEAVPRFMLNDHE